MCLWVEQLIFSLQGHLQLIERSRDVGIKVLLVKIDLQEQFSGWMMFQCSEILSDLCGMGEGLACSPDIESTSIETLVEL
jgi:hypothetical protein